MQSVQVLPFVLAAMLALTFTAEGAGQRTRQANTTLRMPAHGNAYSYTTENAFGDLAFVDPMVVVTPPGENNRVFVVEQAGKIIVVPDLDAPARGLFLDLADRVAWGNPSEEGGVLGLAFHPNYAENGHFFVFYVCQANSAAGNGRHNRLSRFTRSGNDPNRADRNSEVILFSQFDEKFNHNGGSLLFGPDGYLYVTLGDEGHPNDAFNNAQRIDKDFFSAVLRIDVDKRPGSLAPNPHPALGGEVNYRVPPDNPFVGATSFNGRPVNRTRVRTEFWAVGLRSPWRMFWDFPTGTAYLSDVGEESGEEIDLLFAGGNYGWPYRLANDPGPKAAEAPPGFDSVPPLLTYPRGNSGPYVGRAAIGGVVYRGPRLPELNGAYIFGDFYAGNIWMLRHSGNSLQQWQFLTAESQSSIVSFGTDPRNGDVLICDVGTDTIKRLVHAPGGEGAPFTLAETGAFADLQDLEPQPGIVPYDINVPFWSDGALKQRWFSIPNPDRKIETQGRGVWDFPEGTVWIKQFNLEMVKGDPSTARRVETRFLVRDAQGIYGVTYKWNVAQDNATLVGEGGEDQTFTVVENGVARQQTWHFPARNECVSCHTPVAGYALGFNRSQLQRKFDDGNGSMNQLQALVRAGYFQGPPRGGKALVEPGSKARLEARVRSYLAANCANCHQPGGPGRGLWDARITTATARAGIINGALNDMLGNPAARVIAPRSPENSILLYRIATTDPRHRMPPLASSVPDHEAVNLITEWIQSLPVKRKPLAARITHPRGTRAKEALVTVRGTARGDNLARVIYSLNGGPDVSATGAVEWSAEILLEEGRNELIVYAEDTTGNRSRPARRLLNFKPPRNEDAAHRRN